MNELPSKESSATGRDEEGPILEWTVHPVTRRPMLAVGVTLFIIAVGTMVYYSTESGLFGLFALVVLFASLAKYYFPTSYRLTARKVIIKTTTQTLVKDWSAYRSFYRDKNGILLSPFIEPSRLENFRGAYLICRDNIDEVSSFVRERLSASSESVTSEEKSA